MIPDSFLDETKRTIVSNGYALISQVKVSSQDTPYHVPCVYARHVSNVFRLNGKTLFFNLGLNEIEYFWGKKEYWTLVFWMQFKPNKELKEQDGVPKKQNIFVKDKQEINIPMWHEHVDLDNFKRGSLSIYFNYLSDRYLKRKKRLYSTLITQKYEQSKPELLTIGDVVNSINTMRDKVSEFLDEGRIDTVYAEALTNPYCFPDGKQFWLKQFDMQYFKSVVRNFKV